MCAACISSSQEPNANVSDEKSAMWSHKREKMMQYFFVRVKTSVDVFRCPIGFLSLIKHWVGLLWTSDQPFAKVSTYTGQHNI
jgi:hypothetical protein